MNDIIERINLWFQREEMGTSLIKHHLYLHLHRYIEFWGPPNGWNSAPNESNHKNEVKEPSKNNQRRPGTIVKKMAKRYCETRILKIYNRKCSICKENSIDLNQKYLNDNQIQQWFLVFSLLYYLTIKIIIPKCHGMVKDINIGICYQNPL